MRNLSKSPVSYPVNVARLPQKGMPVKIEADAAQRARLAEEHGLLAVRDFRADLTVTSWKRNGIRVAGRVDADIEQECIVTLEPLDAKISEEFSQVFLPQDSKLGREGFHEGGEIHLDAEGPDGPEPFEGDFIDVGALAEEFFGLAIDPYPRKAGVALDAPVADEEPETEGTLREKLQSLTRKS